MTKLHQVADLVDQLNDPMSDSNQIISQLVSFPDRLVEDATLNEDTVIKDQGNGLHIAYCAIFCAFAIYKENIDDVENQKRVGEFIEKLLQNEHIKSELIPDINKSFPDDELGLTLLHIASLYHMTEVVDLLIKSGADIKLKDKKGNTPIHQAIIGIANLTNQNKDASEGFKTIELLVKNKADNKSVNKEGKTPYNLLCENVEDVDSNNLRTSFLNASRGNLSGTLRSAQTSQLAHVEVKSGDLEMV